MTIGSVYLESIIKRFKDYKNLGDKTFEQLSPEDFHYHPNAETNSIAIIIKHMHGNMLSRWTNFLTEDGEKEWRQRDGEFEAQKLTQNELMDLWNQGWDTLLQTVQSLSEDDLLKTVTIRSQPLTVIDAINRQLMHYSYHVGQIVFLGVSLKGAQWGSLSIPKGNSQTYTQSLQQKK